MVKVRWYCGCYISSHDYGTEAQECCHEFVTEEDEQDWEDGACTAQCEVCGNGLTQEYDSPEILV